VEPPAAGVALDYVIDGTPTCGRPGAEAAFRRSLILFEIRLIIRGSERRYMTFHPQPTANNFRTEAQNQIGRAPISAEVMSRSMPASFTGSLAATLAPHIE
jgi:hypothetical protein